MRRHLRLRGRKNFERLRTDGQAIRHPLFVLSYRPNGENNNRYGLIVSRRLGNAVQRNKIRRRLREALRHFNTASTSGFDIALIARPPLIDAHYGDVIDALQQSLQQAGLLDG